MSSSFAGRGRRGFVSFAAALLALAVAAPAALADRGPKPLSPKQGAHLEAGSRVTFKVRDRSANAKRYHVFMTVAAKKRVKHGELQEPKGNESGTFSGMDRHKHGIFTYRPEHYTFPTWFMNKPGKYYWQAYHIDCGVGMPRDCHIVGRIHTFRVVG